MMEEIVTDLKNNSTKVLEKYCVLPDFFPPTFKELENGYRNSEKIVDAIWRDEELYHVLCQKPILVKQLIDNNFLKPSRFFNQYLVLVQTITRL